MIPEVKKCLLLCNRCHKELHGNFWSLEEITQYKFTFCEKSYDFGCRVKAKQFQICKYCEVAFLAKNNKIKFCSVDCKSKGARTIVRPSKDELEALVWEVPSSSLGPLFNVSGKAIEKWCKSYGIKKPPRGYWRKKETNNI